MNATRKRIVIKLAPELQAKADEIVAVAERFKADPDVAVLGEILVEDDPDEEVGILVRVRRCEADLALSLLEHILPARRKSVVSFRSKEAPR